MRRESIPYPPNFKPGGTVSSCIAGFAKGEKLSATDSVLRPALPQSGSIAPQATFFDPRRSLTHSLIMATGFPEKILAAVLTIPTLLILHAPLPAPLLQRARRTPQRYLCPQCRLRPSLLPHDRCGCGTPESANMDALVRRHRRAASGIGRGRSRSPGLREATCCVVVTNGILLVSAWCGRAHWFHRAWRGSFSLPRVILLVATTVAVGLRSYRVADCWVRAAFRRADSIYYSRGAVVVNLLTTVGPPGWSARSCGAAVGSLAADDVIGRFAAMANARRRIFDAIRHAGRADVGNRGAGDLMRLDDGSFTLRHCRR